jgi:hypothetical protein
VYFLTLLKDTLKQNIPLFHKKNFYKISGCYLVWLFTEGNNVISSRSMYPYPVSGLVGTIPKVTINPLVVFSIVLELIAHTSQHFQ